MICPRCSVAEILPTTGQCELCGYVSGGVAVDTHHGADTTTELARRELAHQFRLDVLLGEGVRSVVYLARDLESDQGVVIKVLQRTHDRVADDRFQHSIATLAEVYHPNVVPVRRYGITDSLLWYSMDHVRGRPLRSLLRGGEPMALRACLRLANQLASALDYVHRRGLVHGNLKPENVLVDAEGWVHLCDTAIAASLEVGPPSRATGPLLRPPAYLAPEDWHNGERSPFSDQYSLAVLLHECLTHTVPFGAGAPRPDPAPQSEWRSDLPVHTQQAIHRALSQRPGDRFATVLDFVAGLEIHSNSLMNSRPSGKMAAEILMVPGPDPALRRRRWLWASALAIPAIAGWLLLRGPGETEWADGFAAPVVEDAATEGGGDTSAIAALPPATIPPRDAARPAAQPPTAPARRTTTPRDPSPPARTRQTAPAPAARAPESAPAPAAPAGNGTLFVNATPWGQVFLDGQLIGTTPRANVAVSAGTHTLRILRDGYEPYERTFTVAAGETVRLTGIVLNAQP